MFYKSVLVDFGAREECDVSLVPKKKVGENSKKASDLFNSDITNFGFTIYSIELTSVLELNKSFEILSVNIFFICLFYPRH